MVVIVERRAAGKQHYGEESITNNCFNNFLNWYLLNRNYVINNWASCNTSPDGGSRQTEDLVYV